MLEKNDRILEPESDGDRRVAELTRSRRMACSSDRPSFKLSFPQGARESRNEGMYIHDSHQTD